MSSKLPRFSVGDSVRERFAPAKYRHQETGIVVERYEMGNEWRYVVKGRQELFFERELLSTTPSE